MTQPVSPRPGPRARWGLLMIIIAGIMAALVVLARADRRYESQKRRLKEIETTIEINQEKIGEVQSVLAEHDERAKEWIKEEAEEDAHQ
jgi:uncharacterized protein HemX